MPSTEVTLAGARLTITKAGIYALLGSPRGAAVKAPGAVWLILNGVTFDSRAGAASQVARAELPVVELAVGSTDAIDNTGDLTINGGTFTITAESAFNIDGTGTLNGREINVNGETVSELTNQFGGGIGGGPGGG